MNAYSYVFNNQLKYNDPNGEFGQIALGAIIGGTAGGITNVVYSFAAYHNSDGPKSAYGYIGEIGKGLIVGAASGAASGSLASMGQFAAAGAAGAMIETSLNSMFGNVTDQAPRIPSIGQVAHSGLWGAVGGKVLGGIGPKPIGRLPSTLPGLTGINAQRMATSQVFQSVGSIFIGKATEFKPVK